MKLFRLIMLGCAAVFAQNVFGVNASSDGTGQVLIYPYFSANQMDTVISVTNTTVKPKALKITVREAKRGLATLSFNIYLRGGDSWSALLGTIVDEDSNPLVSRPFMSTASRACTVPSFFTQNDRELPNRSPVVFLRQLRVQGDPQAIERISEGFIEIIEMGELTQGGATLTNARACGSLVRAWLPFGGFWDIDPGLGVEPPTGGLIGSAELFNSEEGLSYHYQAVALDNFSARHLHSFPGNTEPELRDANGGLTPQKTVGTVNTRSGSVDVLWDSGIEAVSAVLSQASAAALFNVSDSIDASTDIIFTLPTRRFFEDPEIVEVGQVAPLAPFVSLYSDEQGASTPINVQLRGSDGLPQTSCGDESVDLPWSVQHLSLGSNAIVRSNFAVETGDVLESRGQIALTPGASTRYNCDGGYRFNAARVGGGANQGSVVELTGLPIVGLRLQRTGMGFLGTAQGSIQRMPDAEAQALTEETPLSVLGSQ